MRRRSSSFERVRRPRDAGKIRGLPAQKAATGEKRGERTDERSVRESGETMGVCECV